VKDLAARARGALLVYLMLLLLGGVSWAQAPDPPDPPDPADVDVDIPEPPEPPHKEISLKGIHVRQGETHHGDISAIAPSGQVEGTQDGDLYLWAGQLRISGTVDGDVFFFGSQLDVTGTIKKSLRAACGNVVIDGTVEGNVFAPAGSVIIGSRGHVKGNMTALSGQFVHNGVVDGTLKFSGGNIVLGGKVGEDAELEADTIQLDKGARVEGDISYSARNRMDSEMKAIAGGDVSFDDRLGDDGRSIGEVGHERAFQLLRHRGGEPRSADHHVREPIAIEVACREARGAELRPGFRPPQNVESDEAAVGRVRKPSGKIESQICSSVCAGHVGSERFEPDLGLPERATERARGIQ